MHALIDRVSSVLQRHYAATLADSTRLRALLDHPRLAIAFLDSRGNVLTLNRAMECMLGYSSAAWAGVSFDTFIHKAPAGGDVTSLKSLLDARAATDQFELEFQRRDRSVFRGRLHLSRARSASGRVCGLVATLDEIVASPNDMHFFHAQKQDALAHLVGGIVHDFNNVLTAIGGYADLLLIEHADVVAGDDLREIIRATQRASALTHQLVAFCRRDTFEVSAIDLNASIEATCSMLRRLLGPHVEIALDLAVGLPLVLADRGHVEQILVNLAVNARDAMPDGGRLVFATTPASPAVRLSVSDTGHGMDERVRAHMFDAFFTTKAPGKGAGLGLSTVARIVDGMRGSIAVDSAPGRGSTFTVDFPAE